MCIRDRSKADPALPYLARYPLALVLHAEDGATPAAASALEMCIRDSGVGELRKAPSYHDRKAGAEIAKGQPLHLALALSLIHI